MAGFLRWGVSRLNLNACQASRQWTHQLPSLCPSRQLTQLAKANTTRNALARKDIFHQAFSGQRHASGRPRRSVPPSPRVQQQDLIREEVKVPPEPQQAPRGPNHDQGKLLKRHRRGKIAIWSIIGINAFMFLSWSAATQGDMNPERQKLDFLLQHTFLLAWRNIREGRGYTMITSAFSHIEPGHFIFNMLAFHAFASVCVGLPGIGALHVLSLTAVSAWAASYCQLKWWERSGRTNNVALGASGVVMGFAAAATCLEPLAGMMVMMVPVPLYVVTLGYIAVDAFCLNDSKTRTGHAAHLGGALGGLVYYVVLLRRGRMTPWELARAYYKTRR